MRFLVVFACAFALCAAQNVDPKKAKILKEQRFNAGDGRAGSAFATEDGTIFKEEADINGNRIGQYSYIGDDGQTYTVKYSAGKDGFRILDGSHIPSTGRDAAAFDADYEETLAAAPAQPAQPAVAQPAFQQQPRVQIQPVQAQPQPAFNDYDSAPVDPNFNPFINPHDPTHRDFRFNKNAAAHAPNSPLSRAASVVPDCADCAGVNPFINPFDASHQQVQHLLGVQPAPRTVAQPAAGQLAGHLAGHQAGFRVAPQPLPQRPKPVSKAQPLPRPAVRKLADQSPLRQATVAPIIKNFFPPGQLKLNRFETGFNFDFES